MEINDEILEESDVYLTKNISSNLHIFQYSVNSSPMSERQQIRVKSRPKHRMFEIETNIDTNSKNFDRRKGELFANNLENDSKANVSNGKRLLDKQTLKSVEVKPTLNQYCIALIRNDCPEIHLTPIESVIQFRPSFHYIENKVELSSSKPKPNSKDESEAEASSQDESEQQSDVQTITMRFAGPDEERQKKAREKSFNYLQQQVAKDPWIQINYHPIESQFSIEEKLSLIYNSSQDNAIDSNNDNNTSIASLEDFLSSMKYSGEEVIKTKSLSELNSSSLVKPSLSQIRVLPLSEQVRLLLVNAKILSFDQILKLLMGKFEPNSVLKNVQMYALLVQGNWVVKSEILYNKDTCPSSPLTGIPNELLCRARDFIIWRFTQSKSLFRKEIFTSEKNQIPQEDVIEILSQISVFDTKTKYWDFLLPEDKNFIEKYPEVVQRQQLLWTNRYTSIERSYSNVIIKTEDNNSNKLPQRKRRNSRKSSINSNSTDDNDSIESLNSDPLLNVTNSEIHTFCSPSAMKLKNERKSPVKIIMNQKFSAPTAIKERRKSKGHKMAVLEINPTISLYPTPEEKKELVKYVIEKLKSSFCTTSSDLRKYICDNSSNKFWYNVSEEVIESAVNECGGFKVQNKWPQNSSQQPLYAFTKFGDQFDGFRDTLLEMFSDHTRVRVSNFVEKIRDKQIFGEKNCENTCLKLLKDYCIFKASMYYLKGTVNAS